MVFYGSGPVRGAPSHRQRVRVTLFPLAGDRARQLSEVLGAEGEWKVNYDLTYARRNANRWIRLRGNAGNTSGVATTSDQGSTGIRASQDSPVSGRRTKRPGLRRSASGDFGISQMHPQK